MNWRGVLGQPRFQLLADPERIADLDQERTQVERDIAARGRDRIDAHVVPEQAQQRLVRAAVHLLPELLDARALEERVDRADGGLSERARERPGEALEVRREVLGERLLRIEVRIELIDEIDGERLADVVVLEELRARVDPRVRVERLALHPERQRADEHDQRPEHDERPDDDRAGPGAQVRVPHAGSVLGLVTGVIIRSG